MGSVGNGDIVRQGRAGHGHAEIKPGLVHNLRRDHFLHFAVGMGRRKGGCKGARGERARVGWEEGRKRMPRRNGLDLEEMTDAVVGGLGRGSKGTPVVEGALVSHSDDGPEEGGRRLGSEGNEPNPARALREGHQGFSAAAPTIATRVSCLVGWGENLEFRFDDGRVEGLDDGVEVGKWDNPCVVVQHFVGANSKNFRSQERFFGGKGKNVLDARSRFVKDLVKPTGQKLGGSNRAARNEDPRLDDERNPIGTPERRGQGGTGREDDRGFGWVPGEPDGASALVVLGLEESIRSKVVSQSAGELVGGAPRRGGGRP